jgi:hypothetical protein
MNNGQYKLAICEVCGRPLHKDQDTLCHACKAMLASDLAACETQRAETLVARNLEELTAYAQIHS